MDVIKILVELVRSHGLFSEAKFPPIPPTHAPEMSHFPA
jgi:hypothetical protein